MTPDAADACITNFLREADRLGVTVRWVKEGMTGRDAAYVAPPGVPGEIHLFDATPRPTASALCTLLSHEMVHVLQHWKGNLRAVPPLGWPVDGAPQGRILSRQQREAYTAQEHPEMVLDAVRALRPVKP